MAAATLSDLRDIRSIVDPEGRAPIDIIVPVYKSLELTTRCLNSLVNNIHEIASCDPRLIVINDSPDDEAVRRMLESFASQNCYVTLLENERNLGFVGTVNRGLAIACKEGRDVVLVNADTETFADTLKNLVAVAYSDPQIGFVSPRSNNASFCSLPHFHGGVLADRLEAFRRWRHLSRTLPPFHFTPTAVGFYLFIKHAVLANFGLLDPEFGVGYEEENDLILRANKVGYRAALANNAFAYHAGSASFTLLDMNLPVHQVANLKKMSERHSEYLPLVRRYENSAHYRAERLLGHTLPTSRGRLKILFDLSTVGPHFNGTNEMSTAIITRFHERHSSRFEINAICSPEAFKFHKLDTFGGIRRHDVELGSPEKFAIGVQLGQPFDLHAISVLEDLAVVNVFGMLDTIADDCGYLSITYDLDALWSHVARNASGLFFNSNYSERIFVTRFPDAQRLPKYSRLLPTRLSSYEKTHGASAAEHVLIMGNHFAHKASDATAEILRAAYPTIQFVVLGKQNMLSANVRAYRAGSLSEDHMESLYTRASVVVLPSHVEGFGFGLVHALAAGKPVVARDIPATREILATYKRVKGVFLYSHDGNLVQSLRSAMNANGSCVDDHAAEGWNEWVDGFADFCARLLEQNDVFDRLTKRIQAGDLLRKSALLARMQASPADPSISPKNSNANQRIFRDERGRTWLPVRPIRRLLRLDGEEFVYSTYVTVLGRLPDSEGLLNYLSELQSGVRKFEIISRIKSSTEARNKRMPLPGYRLSLFRTRLLSLLGIAAR